MITQVEDKQIKAYVYLTRCKGVFKGALVLVCEPNISFSDPKTAITNSQIPFNIYLKNYIGRVKCYVLVPFSESNKRNILWLSLYLVLPISNWKWMKVFRLHSFWIKKTYAPPIRNGVFGLDFFWQIHEPLRKYKLNVWSLSSFHAVLLIFENWECGNFYNDCIWPLHCMTFGSNKYSLQNHHSNHFTHYKRIS